jgi:hypothetical protein
MRPRYFEGARASEHIAPPSRARDDALAKDGGDFLFLIFAEVHERIVELTSR